MTVGANLEQKDRLGYTALTHACAKNHTDVMQLLIAQGANVKHQTLAGNSALHIAVSRHHYDAVRLLASQKADFEQRNHDDQTPMMMAITANDEKMVTTLLEAGDTPYQPVQVVANAARGMVAILDQYKKKHSMLKEIL